MNTTTKEGEPAPKRSYKVRAREIREDAIVEAARTLMAAKGFAAMSIEDVIAEVGISKPTFYSHFVGKDELGVQVLLRAMARSQEHLGGLAASLSPAEAARAMIAWAIDRHYGPNTNYEFAGGLSLFKHEEVRAAESALTDQIADVIRRGQDDGTVRKDVPARLLAQTFHSILKDSVHDDAHKAGTLNVEALTADVATMLLKP